MLLKNFWHLRKSWFCLEKGEFGFANNFIFQWSQSSREMNLFFSLVAVTSKTFKLIQVFEAIEFSFEFWSWERKSVFVLFFKIYATTSLFFLLIRKSWEKNHRGTRFSMITTFGHFLRTEESLLWRIAQLHSCTLALHCRIAEPESRRSAESPRTQALARHESGGLELDVVHGRQRLLRQLLRVGQYLCPGKKFMGLSKA